MKRIKPDLRFQLLISLWIFISLFASLSYAEKFAILFTGETHSALYPCYCPSREGGLARRMTAIKQLREKYPNSLLLDSGGIFAGGILDEYSHDEKIDMRRTEVNMDVVKLMRYDAIAVGAEEFNFGPKFLKKVIKDSKIPFLSCNINFEPIKPYIIRQISGTRFGIIGISPEKIPSAEGIDISEYEKSLIETIKELKTKGADLVILLSQLGDQEDERLAQTLTGIDIIVSGNLMKKTEPLEKIESTLILRPRFQGRSLRYLEFTIEDDKIQGHSIKDISLSKDIPEDPEVISIVPRCFGDSDCKKEGLIGKCINPGERDAKCIFMEYTEIPLLIIKPKECRTCNTETAISNIQQFLPRLNISYLDYETKRGHRLVKRFKIAMLPAYILDEEVEKVPHFARLKEMLRMDKKDNGYLLPPSFTGVSYFLGRETIPKRLDLFVSPLDSSISLALEKVSKFLESNRDKIDFDVHFVVFQKDGDFVAPYGLPETEEDLRQVCIMKYYPAKWWDYAICRSKNPESSWWDDCAENLGIDINKIKDCARSEEGKILLKENIKLTEDLEILRYPIFLLNNQEIFGITESTDTSDLEKIVFEKE